MVGSSAVSISVPKALGEYSVTGSERRCAEGGGRGGRGMLSRFGYPDGAWKARPRTDPTGPALAGPTERDVARIWDIIAR
jgi:hypothetical protein